MDDKILCTNGHVIGAGKIACERCHGTPVNTGEEKKEEAVEEAPATEKTPDEAPAVNGDDGDSTQAPESEEMKNDPVAPENTETPAPSGEVAPEPTTPAV